MNFYEHQDRARKGTGRLVLLFAFGMVGITALVFGVVAALMLLAANNNSELDPAQMPWLQALGGTVFGVGALVGGCSLFKIAQLRSGGGAIVASSLGGHPIDPDTTDPDERKVLNVVEEMSIASGLPVPPVYLLGDEPGINAFAAGYRPETAVVGVTRGCVEQLSRDELQGVIAHEFAHILNGDMRLNIRLIGAIFGILALSVVGRVVVRSMFYSGSSRSRSSGKNEGGGKLVILLVGVALIVIGWVGVLFGKLIQAAVSRQREFLADASAVQYTRNPDGIGGALKRIGGLQYGSRVRSPHAEETAHLFFGQAMSLGGLLATHPPLPERIKRIDPRWDGNFITEERGGAPTSAIAQAAGAAGFAGGVSPGVQRDATGAVRTQGAPAGEASDAVLGGVGELDDAHIAAARAFIAALPDEVRAASRRPNDAQALVFALLVDQDSGVRQKQFALLEREASAAVARLVPALVDTVAGLDRAWRLPVLDMCVPALSNMALAEYRKFSKVAEHLIAADARVDLFEWALREVIRRHVGARFERRQADKVKYGRLAEVKVPMQTVLSVLAHVGQHGDEAAARHAFDEAAAVTGLKDVSLQPRANTDMQAVAASIESLSQLAPKLKQQAAEACVACVAADGKVTGREAELLRVVVEAMGVPVPPILPGAVAS